jgi:hypothetical protein
VQGAVLSVTEALDNSVSCWIHAVSCSGSRVSRRTCDLDTSGGYLVYVSYFLLHSSTSTDSAVEMALAACVVDKHRPALCTLLNSDMPSTISATVCADVVPLSISVT